MIALPVRTLEKKRPHTLKLTPSEFPRLVENGPFFVRLAKAVSIEVAETRIVHDRDGEAGLLVDRFDRLPDKRGVLHKLRLQAHSYLIANGDLHGKNVSVRALVARIALTPA